MTRPDRAFSSGWPSRSADDPPDGACASRPIDAAAPFETDASGWRATRCVVLPGRNRASSQRENDRRRRVRRLRREPTRSTDVCASPGARRFRGPECPLRPFCLPGLRDVYGILFEDFKPLDAGGPQTVAALKTDDVQIGLMFSTDPSIEANGFIPLLDDRHLQNAENIAPVIRTDTLNDDVRGQLDAVARASPARR